VSNLFESRERAYEAKWAHDKETLFEIMAKRNALLGQWAAETMQLSATEIDGYVQAVIQAGVAKKGNGKGRDAVFDKIRGDFAARMLACPDSVIRRKMKDLYDQAVDLVVKKTSPTKP
jgi:hypothetical protein